jgi:hypothetical protein
VVRVDGKKFAGTLVRLTPDVLHLEQGAAMPLVVERYQLSRVERSLGSQPNFGRFFLLGVLVSTGVGAIYGLVVEAPFGPVGTGLAGALIGIPVGLVAGAVVRTEGWEPFTLPAQLDLSLPSSRGGGFGVGVTIRIP